MQSIIALYEPDADLWQRLCEATLTIAALVNKTAEAERQLAALEQDLARMKGQLPTDLPLVGGAVYRRAPCAGIWPPQPVRGGDGAARPAQRLAGETNAWGFAVVSLEQFLAPARGPAGGGRPHPGGGVSERLQEPGLWQHLPLVKQGKVLHLPAVWSFGGLLAARRFCGSAERGPAREIPSDPASHADRQGPPDEPASSRLPAAPRPALLLLIGVLAGRDLATSYRTSPWWQALFSPQLEDAARQAVIHFSWLPRLAICLLAGAAPRPCRYPAAAGAATLASPALGWPLAPSWR